MYANFFGLRCSSFENRADTRFFFETSKCKEVLGALEHESRHGKGVAMLLGETGIGKTLLVRMLALRLHDPNHAVVLTCPPSGKMNIIRETGKAFGIALPSVKSSARSLARLRRHLARAHETDQRSLLIIDQAENLSETNLNSLAALADLEDEHGKLLVILLAGRPKLRPVLEHPDFGWLRRQLSCEQTLPPLTIDETVQYVRHRLQLSGAGDIDLFDKAAIEVIHQAAAGVPRDVNRACDAALAAACSAEQRRVTAAIAMEVTSGSSTLEKSATLRDVGIRSTTDLTKGYSDPQAPHTPPWPQEEPTSPPPPSRSKPQLDYSTAEYDYEAHGDYLEGAGSTGEKSGRRSPGVATAEPAAALYADSKTMLDRLEGTIAKADRVGATSEATLAKQTAVEKHLDSLTPRAQKLVEGLTDVISRAAESLERTQERVDRVLHDAEKRVQSIQTQVTRAAEASFEIEERIERADRASDQAGRVEARLTSFAEQFADRVDTVQEQMTELMSGTEAGQSLCLHLESTVERASAAVTLAQTTADAARTKLKEESEARESEWRKRESEIEAALQAAQQRVESSAATAAADRETTLQGQFDSLRCSLQEVAETARQQLGGLRGDAESALDDTRSALKTEIDAHNRLMREITDTARNQIHEARTNAESTLKDTKADHQLVMEAVATSANRIKSLYEDIEAVECRRVELESSVNKTGEGVESLTSRAVDIADIIGETQRQADALCERAEAARAKTALVVDRGEKFMLDVRESLGQIGTLQRNIATTLVDIGSACQNVNAISAQAAQGEQLVARLSTGQELAAEVSTRLAELVMAGGRQQDDMRRVLADTREMIARFDSQYGGAGETLSRIEDADSSIQTAIQRAIDATVSTDDATAEAKRQAEMLTSINTAGEMTLRQISEIVQHVTGLQERVQTAGAEAMEKIGQLDSYNAAAEELLGKIEDVGNNTEGATDRAIRAIEQAKSVSSEIEAQLERLSSARVADGDAAARLEELVSSAGQLRGALGTLAIDVDEKITQLNSHSAAAKQVLHELAEANKQGHSVVEQTDTSAKAAQQAVQAADRQISEIVQEIGSLTTKARADAERLAHAVDTAEQRTSRISDDCAQASSLVERLPAIARAIDTAKAIEESIRSTIESAETVYRRVSLAGEEASDQRAELEAAAVTTTQLIAKHEELQAETDEAAEKLAEEISNTTASMEAGERLLKEFVTQSEKLGGELSALHRKVNTVEESLAQATERPNEVIATAQTQAIELERVCGAVRKVFAALSQTTLGAKRQVDELRRTSEEADKRLARLTEETNRGSQTLCEWVDEAGRVQTRLEKTLQSCPSISETHPSDSLAGISKTVSQPIRRAASVRTTDASPATEPPPSPDSGAGSDKRGDDKEEGLHSKVEEITQLVQEAKQATGIKR
ncbi:MAG: AAA family ATPase [Phycisphaerales bacterium]|nr:MAG: AAA family ATPase [Phycisphaerales bacterium]